MTNHDLTVARYYYENLDNLVTFLATKPDGKLSILVGTDSDTETVLTDLLLRIKATSVVLGQWLISAMAIGQVTFKVSPKTDLPQEVNLTTYTGE